MNTYQVQCHKYLRLPRETIEAPHSFAARKQYAELHNVPFGECFAQRVWDVASRTLTREERQARNDYREAARID